MTLSLSLTFFHLSLTFFREKKTLTRSDLHESRVRKTSGTRHGIGNMVKFSRSGVKTGVACVGTAELNSPNETNDRNDDIDIYYTILYR